MSSKDDDDDDDDDNENDKILISSNEDNENENENENEVDDDDDDDDDETKSKDEKNKIEGNKRKKWSSDEIIDKSKSFEEHIKSLKKLEGLKGYWPYNDFGNKELKSKYFKK